MKLYTFFFLCFSILFQSTYPQTSEEQDMLNLVNNLRQNRGLESLRLNTELNLAAYNHSNDMAINNYFSHTGLNNSNFAERAREAGYVGSPRGENIAAGNSGVQATFNQWFNSSGHLNNMLNSDINEMGIGRAYSSDSKYGHYWTQIFGKGDQTLTNEDIARIEHIEVYPNPARDKLTIKLKNNIDTNIKFKLVSVTGQVVRQTSTNLINDALTIDIQNLTTGIYFLYLNKTTKGYKIIKI